MKRIWLFVAAAASSTVIGMTAFAGSWQYDEAGRRYRKSVFLDAMEY